MKTLLLRAFYESNTHIIRHSYTT